MKTPLFPTSPEQEREWLYARLRELAQFAEYAESYIDMYGPGWPERWRTVNPLTSDTLDVISRYEHGLPMVTQ
jgi:hypothetical protein